MASGILKLRGRIYTLDLVSRLPKRLFAIVRTYMADSSTQHENEYEHIVLRSIAVTLLTQLAAKADQMASMWILQKHLLLLAQMVLRIRVSIL
jgi:hypothetical protein